MSRACGIVGMPNVGKSTLFNALTRTQLAQAANFPFCTIEPTSALVAVPDSRLKVLGSIAQSAACVPKQLRFMDIAGLIRGASEGAGLGNKFLSTIRNCEVIVHLVRCFDGGDIIHVENSVDPVRDIHIINNELILADLSSAEKRLGSGKKGPKGALAGWNSEAEGQLAAQLLKESFKLLSDGLPVSKLIPGLSQLELGVLRRLQFLSSKPVLYACNVADAASTGGTSMTAAVREVIGDDAGMAIVCASLEAEAAELGSEEDITAYLKELGMQETGLSQVIRLSSSLLGMHTYYTVGPTETRAWDIRVGATAPQAAGVIHTDFERGFIRAEVISYEDYVSCGSEAVAKAQGKLRSEGKEYVVQDGDVILFRFNV